MRSSDKQDNYGFVASAGRYFGNTLIYARGFILHDPFRWNQAYSISAKHYYDENNPSSYVTLIVDIGTSPDDPARYQFLTHSSDFLSRSISAGGQHRLNNWGIGIMGTWNHYKIAEQQFNQQYDLNLSLKKYF